jgi:hypothetical protein
MSRTNNWRTERRTKAQLANGEQYGMTDADDMSVLTRSTMHTLQTRRTLPLGVDDDCSDESSDDELPGAYAVTRGASERHLGWDPTAQFEPQVVLPLAVDPDEETFNDDSLGDNTMLDRSSARGTLADGGTIAETQAPLNHFSDVLSQPDFGEVTVMQMPLEKAKQFSTRKYMWIGIIIIIIGCSVVGAVAAVMLMSGGDGKPEGSMSSGECTVSADALVECDCFMSAIAEDEPTHERYLYAKHEIEDLLGMDIEANSCSPENIALVWVAMDITRTAEDGGEASPEIIQNRFMLVLLYILWGGENWRHSGSWLHEVSECDWYGIECDDQRRITSISLPQNTVRGPLDSRLGLLDALKKIDMGFNQVSGSIPSELFNLPNFGECFVDPRPYV